MVRLRKYFVAGLLVVMPLFLSIWILIFLFRFADGILGKYINIYMQKTLGFYIPGLGVLLFLAIVLLTGFLSTRFFGKIFSHSLDRLIDRFPLLKYIYPSLKQIFQFMFSKEQIAFKKSVLLEFPCKGRWSLGFVTNDGFKEANEKIAEDLVNVYIPLVPNPASGFYVLAPRKDIIFLDIDIKDTLALIFSGGVLNPQDVLKHQSKQPPREKAVGS